MEQKTFDCPTCGGETYTKRVKMHVGAYCKKCGFVKWLQQPWQSFVMPIGRYAGQTLEEIKKKDADYLRWCANTLESKSIAARCKEAMESELVRIDAILKGMT